jgi:Fe-S-cluster-containing dehydrogenase component
MKHKPRESQHYPPSRGYLVFDPELCTGCHICEAVCSFVKEGHVRPEVSRIQVHMDPFLGTIEDFMPKPCLQCDTPQCMIACPVEGAMDIDKKTGARLINEKKCVEGCKKCMEACGLYFDPPRILFHPDKKNCVKCDLCGGAPECVKWCPNGALKFINRSEFVEKGSSYQFSFTEAFEKDFGPSFEPFEGERWRYKGPWLREIE